MIAGHEAFDFELVSVETFDDGHVYLAPTRPERFGALIDAVWRRWPDHPPYKGAFETVAPHLTISDRPLECAIDLPIAARADTVTLIEEQADGRWLSRRRFAPEMTTGAGREPGSRQKPHGSRKSIAGVLSSV